MGNRKIISVFSQSKSVWKFFVPFFSIFLLSVIVIVSIQWKVSQYSFNSEALAAGNIRNQLIYNQLAQQISIFATLGLLALAAITLFFFLTYSQRYIGSQIPIQKFLKELQNGNYSARVKLRKKDAYRELAIELNKLANVLEERNNKNL